MAAAPRRGRRLGAHSGIAIPGSFPRSRMQKYVVIGVAVVAAVLIVPRALKNVQKWSVRQDLQHKVANLRLPHVLGPGETETRAELGDNVLRTWYTLDATFATDEATKTEFLALVKKTACSDPAPREFLSRGYSLDRTYDVAAPTGRTQFHTVITPADCP